MIIAGFPCIGKTTMAAKHNKVLDLSSTPFHYIVDLEQINEGLKGKENSLPLNPNWPQNYIDEIIRVKDLYDVVFILARDYILDELNKLKITYIVAVPEVDLKDEYISRAVNRGNDQSFIQGFQLRYNKWRDMMIGQPVKKIYLKKGEFIEDTLKRLNLFGGFNETKIY